VSRRSDYLSAAVWAAFGLVVAVAAWRLDRLESLSINPWSVPGLLPGLVGVLIILLAVVLAVQARWQGSPAESDLPLAGEAAGASGAANAGGPGEGGTGGDVGHTVIAGGMCVLFAGVSLGHGLPFFAEGAAFIFLFIAVFSWSEWRARSHLARGLATALLIALAASGLISWLFESVFLVRLP